MDFLETPSLDLPPYLKIVGYATLEILLTIHKPFDSNVFSKVVIYYLLSVFV